MGMEGKERNRTEEEKEGGTFRSHLPPLCAFYNHCPFPTQRSKKNFCVCERDYRLGVKKKFTSLVIHVSGILLLYLFLIKTIWTFFC